MKKSSYEAHPSTRYSPAPVHFTFIRCAGTALLLILPWMTGCSPSENTSPNASSQDHFLVANASSEDWDGLHHIQGVYRDITCQLSFESIRSAWENGAFETDSESQDQFSDDHLKCAWTRIQFYNPGAADQVHFIYAYHAWKTVTIYLQSGDGTFSRQTLGLDVNQEILPVRIPARDTLYMYIRYPETVQAFLPTADLKEISAQHYFSLNKRSSLKYLILGFLGFPVLFFFIVYLLERDKIILAYLLFLLGSAFNMLSILDTTPYFDFTPKLVHSTDLIRRFFVLGGFLSLAALIKYIHYLLEVKVWSSLLHKAGQVIIIAFGIVIAVPLLGTRLFSNENYESYLQVYRITAFMTIIYISWLCIYSTIRRISFSKTLLLSFLPFLVCTLYYAIRFIILREYSSTSTASLILIGGFYLTIILFGIILGVRNNRVKEDKFRLEKEAMHLKELDHFKSRFYTNFTHEFRTPLTVINGMVDQINGHERERMLIRRNAGHLLHTVNDLLDLSKLESDRLSIEWTAGNVVPYLNYLTESCSSLAQEKHINLAFFSDEGEIIMDYDETKLQQILLNLLSNAIKFTPEYGSVKVIARKKIKADNSFLQLEVRDTGHGIKKDDQEHIFDRFYQSGEMNHAEGTGIGLALVSELTILLNGSIKLASSIDKGSTFTVLLPIYNKGKVQLENTPQLHQGKEMELPPVKQDSGNVDLPLVLVIEDNADVAEYIISCIQQEYRVRHARNGKSGSELAMDIIPDIVISDVMMPEMDGFEVCHVLKSDRRTSHIPIILLTAKATLEDKLTGLKQGADAYLTKPFNKEELQVRLANMVEWSRRLQEGLKSPGNYSNVVEQKEADFLKEVMELVERNMENENFNTDLLCRKIGMSRTQLHRKLKALTGTSTASFIRSHRLQKANDLLQTTDMQIGEIALHVGFKDFSHFTRSFAREFGKTPSDIRQL